MSFTRVFQTPLFRKPLFVMLAAEALLVLAFGGLAWHVWQSRQEAGNASAGAIPAQPPQRSEVGPARLPAPSTAPRASPRHPSPAAPTPGFRVDADFLARQFQDINRDQARLESIEWRLVKGAMQGMKSYLERVVVPRVERAEGRSG
jgi:hypothetical protein